MGTTTQSDRLLKILTLLPEDELLINNFACEESISELFEIEVELLREEESEEVFKFTPVDIHQILGQRGTIQITQEDGGERFFSGIFKSFQQIGRHRNFSKYRGVIVPNIWKLTKNFKSRIYQHISVPDILSEVLEGYEFKLQLQRDYKKRNYCVQYQESDFDFISRLMEEEGIYYYFEHTADVERMVIRDDYKNPEDCPNKSEVSVYDNELISEDQWESTVSDLYINYELTSGKHVYRDHNFELPTKKLETEKMSRFDIGGNQEMETYVYPGEYARKYDGIDKTGGSQTGELDNIFDDNKTLATNQMLANDSGYKVIHGESDCCTFTAGYRYELQNHPNRDLNSPYILTTVHHSSDQVPGYEVGGGEDPDGYKNSFSSIAHGSGHPEFRPQLKTQKPIITGTQSAYVVGPEGEEIFTDEYGRVKVQFQWDREGEVDANSSCWLRVLQAWAGNRWGMMFIPRIGMEVIVNFIEGDPDQPVVAGCVYNPQTMPPYELPAEKTKSTIKSDSSKGGKGFNEIRLEDKKGSEQIFVHGEKDIDVRNKNDRREWVGNDQHYYVHRDRRDQVHRDEHRIVERHKFENVTENSHREVGSNENIKISGSQSLDVGGDITVKSMNNSTEATSAVSVKGMNVVVEAMTSLTLKVGGNFVNINSAGVFIKGTMVLLNSGGAAGTGSYPSAVAPSGAEEPDMADNDEPGSKIELEKQSAARNEKTHRDGDEEKKSWVKLKLVDEEGEPISGVGYKVTCPDGRVASGTTDKDGKGEVKNMDPGNCEITFPDLDKEAWEDA